MRLIRRTTSYPWGWKTRPWSWMDDAVWFDLEEAPWLGMPLDPWSVNPIVDPLTDESFDVAFELDTDPNYIKWEQAYDSIRHWPHYEDILSMAGPVTETKWRQDPDPNGWDIAFAGAPADDWLCTETGPVSDIHFWCSWRIDAARPISSIEVSIWSDDPCGLGGHSEPNQQLWRRRFLPGQFTVSWAGEGEQGYFDPVTSFSWRPDHNNYYRIDIEDINDPFVQTEGNIYWLDIFMLAEGMAGWKTSLDHWNDKAAWYDTSGIPWRWRELYDPCTGEGLDFAFELGTKKDYGLRAQAADDWRCDRNTPVTAAVWWGSYIGYQYQACQDPLMAAPVQPDAFLLSIWTDVAAGADPCYPFSHPGEKIWEYRADDYDEVLVGYDKHPEDPNRLGIEPVFRYSVRLPDDDWFLQEEVDGIYWFSVVAVYDQNIPNYDWGWTNHEQYHNDNAVTGRLEPPPAGGWKWYELYDQTGEGADMSFILFTEPQQPEELDFGDAPDPCYPTLLANDGARHIIGGPYFCDPVGGDAPDPEPDGQPDAAATGDDNNADDDEDGVSFPQLIPGQPGIVALNVCGGGGIVDIWIDYNGDEDWDDPGEFEFSGWMGDGPNTVIVNP
ncbi:MAG: DUF7901 domain-containing protein, partial [Planctomycetota bacterium]